MQEEKRELLNKVDKLEQGKARMEKILKKNMSNKQDPLKTELQEELGVLMKRIEFLE
jgi:hypothetical protein